MVYRSNQEELGVLFYVEIELIQSQTNGDIAHNDGMLLTQQMQRLKVVNRFGSKSSEITFLVE